MSSIHLVGDSLYQVFREQRAELGYLAPEGEQWVLWLRDHTGIAGTPGACLRGGEWSSREDAVLGYQDAAAATIMHMVWLNSPNLRLMGVEGRLFEGLDQRIGEVNDNIDRHFEKVYPNTDFEDDSGGS